MSAFPINTSIPATNNRPADDQPDMKTNFGNINSYLKVDHTDPAAIQAGQHMQVTFNSNHVPAVPTTPPVLFTNTVAPQAIPQLYWYTGSNTQGASQYQNSGNQSSSLQLGGIIIKTGRFGAIGGGSTDFPVTFGSIGLTNFPNALLAVIPTVSNPNITAGIKDGTLSTTGFNILKSSSSAVTIFFVAIGY